MDARPELVKKMAAGCVRYAMRPPEQRRQCNLALRIGGSGSVPCFRHVGERRARSCAIWRCEHEKPFFHAARPGGDRLVVERTGVGHERAVGTRTDALYRRGQ